MIDKTFLIHEEQRLERERLSSSQSESRSETQEEVLQGPAPPYPGPPLPPSPPSSAQGPSAPHAPPQPRSEPSSLPHSASTGFGLPPPVTADEVQRRQYDWARSVRWRTNKRFFGAWACAVILYAIASLMTMSGVHSAHRADRDRDRHRDDDYPSPTFSRPAAPFPTPSAPTRPPHVASECLTLREDDSIGPLPFIRNPKSLFVHQDSALPEHHIVLGDRPRYKNRLHGDVRLRVKGLKGQEGVIKEGRVCLKIVEDNLGQIMIEATPEKHNFTFVPHLIINVPTDDATLTEFSAGGQKLIVVSTLDRPNVDFAIASNHDISVTLASSADLKVASNGSISLDATVTKAAHLYADPGSIDATLKVKSPHVKEEEWSPEFIVEAMSSKENVNITILEQPPKSLLNVEVSTPFGGQRVVLPQEYEGSFGLASIEDLRVNGPLNTTDPIGEGRKRHFQIADIYRVRHGRVWWGERDDDGLGVDELGHVRLAAWTGDVELVFR